MDKLNICNLWTFTAYYSFWDRTIQSKILLGKFDTIRSKRPPPAATHEKWVQTFAKLVSSSVDRSTAVHL